ncbi:MULTISPECIES: lantibiotic dehydratase [unclassified Flavobacterium]|uniref:lantibiotic dehydratase n=1 Tax=unclassified Flavobacterium TaxID=196869 RepID=UPI00131C78AE|nr:MULTISPECIES: lantibiotic dehydratase [unclassified Flavobacterium]
MIFFNTIIKRVANFSIQSYEEHKHNFSFFFETNELFNLCILTSSGSLYNDVTKNKSEKTEGSLYNYFVRAHFNPTPFGVFNSVGVLHWGNETTIAKNETLRLMVKYDNLFVSSKIDESIRENWLDLSYCANPSIYFLNDQKIGFYKSKNKGNDKIEISYTEIDFDEDLLWLIRQFKNGKKIDLVVEELISQGFDNAVIEDFLLETIETGLIIETFLFNSYTNKLNNPFSSYLSGLITQKEHLLETKKDIVNFSQAYIREQNNFFENNDRPKDFYAINSFDIETGCLDINIQDKVKKYIDFAVHYNAQTTAINDNLSKFVNKVNDRFNDGFIPFNTIFNPYSGISYGDIKTANELKLHRDIETKILTSTGNSLFLNLPTEENIEIKSTKLPATFNVVLETLICKVSGESIIFIKGLGEPSSLNIISRFSDIAQSACQDIVDYEKELNKNKILADINCVGSFRSINVAPTERRHDYCLPINTAYNERNNPVFLSDIYIHLHNNNLSLVSKEHQKEVLPKKVSAINSKLLESDIYNFLCDYEFYNNEIYAVNFNFNAYRLRLPYVPRIYLDLGILLYPAQILLVFNDFSIQEFISYLQEKIKEHSFSKKILISEGHREVILDTENKKNLVLLYEKVKSTKHIYISECLYDFFDPAITRDNENFAHELIVSVKNPYYTRQNIDYAKMNISVIESENTAVVSDWLYLELFCNIYADSEIFNAVYTKIIQENKTDKFFFVNYSNPERHLRLRFKTKSIENKQYIITVVQELKLRNIISKYHILPYEQEIHRYGGIEMMEFSETIFDLDSRDFLVNVANNDLEESGFKIIAILKIKNYLAFLGFSLDEMILNCESVLKNYSKEFELTAQLRKEFNKEYAAMKFKIDGYEYPDFLEKKSLKDQFVKKSNASPNLQLVSYAWLLIHMSMNRHFKENQRFNEFKSYYLVKCYLNQLKFTANKTIKIEKFPQFQTGRF